MKTKVVIQEVIVDNQNRDFKSVNKRDINLPLNTTKIISLTGVRRSGKTFILLDTIQRLIKNKVDKTKIIHINFEDERLQLNTNDLDLILQSYRELYPENNLSDCYFFFDEIQNIPQWEKFVRRLHENICTNIFITGSNSKMLSSDISTTLRGRNLNFEIFPLTFKEYLEFNDIKTNTNGSKQKSLVINYLKKYIKGGGFPELLNIPKVYTQKVLQEYFYVMLYKDLIERYNISNASTLKYFLNRILVNIGKPTSVNKIFNELKSNGYKVSKNTLYDYLEYSEAIYLNFSLSKFDFSLIKRENSEKKNYFIDNGLINALSFKFSDNYGLLLENAVYLFLRQKYKDNLYYFKDNKECDFVVYENETITDLIQVCYNIDDTDTFKREKKSLMYAGEKLNVSEGTILTFDDDEDEIIENGFKIKLIPVYKYFLKD